MHYAVRSSSVVHYVHLICVMLRKKMHLYLSGVRRFHKRDIECHRIINTVESESHKCRLLRCVMFSTEYVSSTNTVLFFISILFWVEVS